MALLAVAGGIVASFLPAHAALPGRAGRIAFISNRTGSNEIYTMNPDGGDVHRLTINGLAEVQPSWSPDGASIAFAASPESGPRDLYVMSAQGSGVTNLTTTPSDEEQAPSWSPDGRTLLFTRSVDFPDGGNSDVYTMPSTGGVATQLTFSGGTEGGPVWSADGSRIAFALAAPEHDIYSMAPDGSDVVNLTDGAGVGNVQPDWSPGSEQIAFTSRRPLSADDDAPKEDVWVMAVDGSMQVNLTATPGSDANPTWSPQGDAIAYEAMFDGNPEIMIMPSGGGTGVQITDADGGSFDPTWERTPAPPCTAWGTGGNDSILGSSANDVLCGWEGDDALAGGAGEDVVYGGSGADRIVGGAGADVLNGQEGSDIVRGDVGDDRLLGGPGGDSITGSDGADTLNDHKGKDLLIGSAGKDRLDARDGSGGDELRGGPGRDKCLADAGDDVMSC